MKKWTFDDIRKEGLLLYEYVRGSTAYGLNLIDENGNNLSDVDTGGVYLEPIEQILGLGLDFQEQIDDEKHDTTWYSLKKFMNLLLKSNPTVLEALFIPDEFVIYEHPIFTEIKKHRQDFVTKACLNSCPAFAYSQIKKCKGQNKLIVNPIKKRLWPLDFCYTTYRQGTANMREWLAHRGLEQKYCGLVSLNNMPSCFSVFYDWGQHMKDKGYTIDDIYNGYNGKDYDDQLYKFSDYVKKAQIDYDDEVYEYGIKHDILWGVCEWFEKNKEPQFYRGIVAEDGRSDEVRCSSVKKDEEPICMLCFNINGYGTHCKKYKEYTDWVKKRNPVRYESNKDATYDSKNLMHCFRLLHMGKELAQNGSFIVSRRGIDADFLLDIRAHKYTYEWIVEHAEKEFSEMEELMKTSTLPEEIDKEFVNDLLVGIRNKYQLEK